MPPSERTVKYFEARIREGPNFDYSKWLLSVEEEEACGGAPSVLERTAVSETAAPANSVDQKMGPLKSPVVAIASTAPSLTSKVLSKKDRLEARIGRRLERVCDAWKIFQASRARDAVYGYLEAVFALVERYKGGRKTRRLLRCAFKSAGLQLETLGGPFAVLIHCTCDGGLDNRTISKWSRALQYVADRKRPQTPLKSFMKEVGGINVCAERYARDRRRSPCL